MWALLNPFTGPLGPLWLILVGILLATAILGHSERK